MQPKDFELKMEEMCNDVICVLYKYTLKDQNQFWKFFLYFSILHFFYRFYSLLWKGINGNNARPEDTVANEVSQQYIQIQRKADSKKSRPKILIWEKITLFVNDIIYFTAMQ